MGRDLTIDYNTSGSATTSGCGPATAVTGSSAYSGDGAGGGTQTVIDLSGDSPDLSGVLVDDIIWIDVQEKAQRNLFPITAVDNTAKTVTVSEAPNTAISSGDTRNWGIGGQRSTLFDDIGAGSQDHCFDGFSWRGLWTIVLEAGQTWTDASDGSFTSFTTGGSDRILIKSDTPGTQATLRSVRDTRSFACNNMMMIDINYEVDNSSGSAGSPGANSDYLRCRFHNARTGRDWGSRNRCTYTECEFSGWNSGPAGQEGPIYYINCKFDGVPVEVAYNAHRAQNSIFVGCVFINAPSPAAINVPQTIGQGGGGSNSLAVLNCTFFNSTGDDIRIADNWGSYTSDRFRLVAVNNISNDCGGYFINDQSTGGATALSDPEDFPVTGAGNMLIHHNLINGATSGDYSNTAFSGFGDVSGDPLFVSETPGAEDLNLSAGSPAIDAGSAAPADS